MRITTICLVTLGLSLPLTAQKVCLTENETLSTGVTAVIAGWYAVKGQAPRDLNVTALEMNIYATRDATVGEMRLYDEDPITGRPNQLLASAPVIVNASHAFYGTMVAPTPLTAGQNFFIATRIGPAGTAAINASFSYSQGVKTPHCYMNTATSTLHWSGPTQPMNSWAWRYRLYCDTHTGSWNYYGAPKPGTFGRRPILLGLGYPNLGNRITLQVSSGQRNAPAAILLGMRADIPFQPFGTVYVFPALVTIPGVLQGGALLPSWNLTFRVPDTPTITGGRIAAQSLILDSGATFGLAHTGGAEIVVGN